MKTEEPQSLESQLKMVRPRRAEVKRVPLTPEEKDFLGEIMDKAVAAEKAGELQEALNFYTDYKNELLKIKEKKVEKEIKDVKVARAHLISWAIQIYSWEENAANYVDAAFILDELPVIKTKSDLNLRSMKLSFLPNNLRINGNLSLVNSTVEKMPANLHVTQTCTFVNANIDCLPNSLRVEGSLSLSGTSIKNKKIPDDIYVGGRVYIKEHETEMIKELVKRKKEGKIKGEIDLK